MPVGVIVDPRRAAGAGEGSAGPALTDVHGKRIGFRLDELWKSWEWVADEWRGMLEERGAEVVTWRAPIGKGKDLAADGKQSLSSFLDSLDAGIFGLCTCGSCTLWATHDAVACLERDLPTVAVATSHFEALARRLAKARGRAEIRVKAMPYPLEGRPEPEVRQIARDHFDDLLATFAATTPEAVAA